MRRAIVPALVIGSSVALLVRAQEPPQVAPPAKPAAEKPITNEDRRHWAFLPPVRPQVPDVRERGWIRNPIDSFILSGLEAGGLHPAPGADRLALLRRLCFDLIGLPPTPEEQDAFVSDPSPDAYEKVVDRLLASPHYGERWAQHWLDLARYADTDGFEFDQTRPDAWRYRDWVVEALNRDMPYDDFVRWQLAGDEVEPDKAAAFIATGFNRCYPDMVDLNDQGLRRQNALNDVTETTGLVFLGLTIGCARCHDHKFDPIRQSDFYRLQAFFTPARFRDDFPIVPPEERGVYERRQAAWEEAVAAAERAVMGLESPVREAFAPGLPEVLNDELVAAFQKADPDRTPRDVHLVYEALARDRRISKELMSVALGSSTNTFRYLLLTQLEGLRKEAPAPPPHARGLDEASSTPPPTYLLHRGDFSARGPEVQPAFPAVLTRPVADPTVEIHSSARSSGRRRALADWLLKPDHPLTGRVMANRLWQYHFGRGIVATPSDFGTMGAEPTHPELLDWLATEFVERGWSLKAIHRLMVTSATYRQSSRPAPDALTADPDNTLFGRWGRQRLDGEAIRDALLAVSGQLNRKRGGPCIFPELPAELTKLSSKGAVWPVSPRSEDRNRRSLYVFLRRNLRFPFFEAFDRPDTNASCARRAITTIAPQALSLLNSKLAYEAAHGLADRATRGAGDGLDRQVEGAYRLALGRAPDGAERALARHFLEGGPETAFVDFCLALLNVNEFVYVE